MTTLSPALTTILRTARAEINCAFAEARRRFPSLDGDAVLTVVREILVAPLTVVERAAPERLYPAFTALFRASLELSGRALLGPGAKSPWLTEAWRELIPRLEPLLAEDPERCARLVTNALHQVSSTHGARAREWLDILARAAPHIRTFAALESVAGIAAWRSGLAHLRGFALDTLPALAPELLAALAGRDGAAERITSGIESMRADPWRGIEEVLDSASVASDTLVIRSTVGGFRGFGGPFVAPPVVAAHEDGILVADGELTWVITADCYGATLHPVEAPPPPKERPADADLGHLRENFSELSDAKSAARFGPTVAVSVEHSHLVYLLAPQ